MGFGLLALAECDIVFASPRLFAWAVDGPRSVIRPCLRFRATIHTFTGYATANPTMTPSDITPQKSSSVGSMARMSRPIISRLITGAMPAIIAFMLMNSGVNDLRTFAQ